MADIETSNARAQSYKIGPENVSRYAQLFQSLDNDHDGFLGGAECVPFLEKSQLPRHVLRDIWTLADRDCDGRLDVGEFCVAIHLSLGIKNGDFDLPKTLPKELARENVQALFDPLGNTFVDKTPAESIPDVLGTRCGEEQRTGSSAGSAHTLQSSEDQSNDVKLQSSSSNHLGLKCSLNVQEKSDRDGKANESDQQRAPSPVSSSQSFLGPSQTVNVNVSILDDSSSSDSTSTDQREKKKASISSAFSDLSDLLDDGISVKQPSQVVEDPEAPSATPQLGNSLRVANEPSHLHPEGQFSEPKVDAAESLSDPVSRNVKAISQESIIFESKEHVDLSGIARFLRIQVEAAKNQISSMNQWARFIAESTNTMRSEKESIFKSLIGQDIKASSKDDAKLKLVTVLRKLRSDIDVLRSGKGSRDHQGTMQQPACRNCGKSISSPITSPATESLTSSSSSKAERASDVTDALQLSIDTKGAELSFKSLNEDTAPRGAQVYKRSSDFETGLSHQIIDSPIGNIPMESELQNSLNTKVPSSSTVSSVQGFPGFVSQDGTRPEANDETESPMPKEDFDAFPSVVESPEDFPDDSIFDEGFPSEFANGETVEAVQERQEKTRDQDGGEESSNFSVDQRSSNSNSADLGAVKAEGRKSLFDGDDAFLAFDVDASDTNTVDDPSETNLSFEADFGEGEKAHSLNTAGIEAKVDNSSQEDEFAFDVAFDKVTTKERKPVAGGSFEPFADTTDTVSAGFFADFGDSPSRAGPETGGFDPFSNFGQEDANRPSGSSKRSDDDFGFGAFDVQFS